MFADGIFQRMRRSLPSGSTPPSYMLKLATNQVPEESRNVSRTSTVNFGATPYWSYGRREVIAWTVLRAKGFILSDERTPGPRDIPVCFLAGRRDRVIGYVGLYNASASTTTQTSW
jgi:hypothetical protein